MKKFTFLTIMIILSLLNLNSVDTDQINFEIRELDISDISPVIATYNTINIINEQIETILLEICHKFRYFPSHSTNNIFRGTNERNGNCNDYAVHFAWEWNKRNSDLGTAYIVAYSSTHRNGRGYFIVDDIMPNRTHHRNAFGARADYHFFSTDGREVYYAIKTYEFDHRITRIWPDHIWNLIVTDNYYIIVDAQASDHLGKLIYEYVNKSIKLKLKENLIL